MATDSQKRAAGIKGLTYFHNKSLEYPDYQFTNDFDGLIAQIDFISPTWLKNFGNATLVTDPPMDDPPPWYVTGNISVLQDVMEKLSSNLEGMAPANQEGLQLFFDALSANYDGFWPMIRQMKNGAAFAFERITTAAVTTVKAAIVGYSLYKIISIAAAVIVPVVALYKAFKKSPKLATNPKRKKSCRK